MEKMMDGSKNSGRNLSHSGHQGGTGSRTWPHLGYPVRKQAAAAFRKISRNTLELISNIYRGDDRRHRVLHLACGHFFHLSLSELKSLGYKNACPFCSSTTDDLRRFTGIEEVQAFVFSSSLNGAHFMAGNHLGSTEANYRFYCLRDHLAYETSFGTFMKDRGTTNACPVCSAKQIPV